MTAAVAAANRRCRRVEWATGLCRSVLRGFIGSRIARLDPQNRAITGFTPGTAWNRRSHANSGGSDDAGPRCRVHGAVLRGRDRRDHDRTEPLAREAGFAQGPAAPGVARGVPAVEREERHALAARLDEPAVAEVQRRM